MSERLLKVFAENKAIKKPTFVAFLTAGYPTRKETIPLLLAMQEGGADIIELGIPYSDPVADGATIQEASTVALEGGTTPAMCLHFVKEAREAGLTVPVVLMGYFNPIYKYGERKMVADAKAAGVDGFIVVDLPPEESKEFYNCCVEQKIAFVPLIAPNTTDRRLDFVNTIANSFVYCVSLLGVTGGRTELPKELPDFIKRVKSRVKAPIAIGFGISTRETFLEVSRLGEGVVVGSSLIKAISSAPEGTRADALRDACKLFVTPKGDEGAHVAVAEQDLEIVRSPADVSVRLPAHFGEFGGTYAPETLMGALDELELAYISLRDDPEFQKEVRSFYSYVGRPTPLYFAERLSKESGGAKIWLKREDLAHTGAHKINNAIGQALIAKRLGKPRIIAETGAGQHGVATATICAKLGLECVIYMGAEDVQRQSLNVFKMKCMGAQVIPVHSGTKTLKDAVNEAMRDWVTNIRTTHYLIGSAIGPHPFPTIVRDFQSVIGIESRKQFMEATGKLPEVVLACVGGGSNSIGMFHPFVNDTGVRLIGVEAAGEGISGLKHSATLAKGTIGIIHGTRTIMLQDENGQISETHSVSAGLDYPGVGPEHAHLKTSGRAEYVAVDDREAVEGFKILAEKEGILPALETSHAIFYAINLAKTMKPDQDILICLSGRGDKDMGTIARVLNVTL